MDEQWWVPDPNALEWRSWDGEVVLYDERSGEILYFDPETSAIFEMLTTAPTSLHDLTTELADELQVQADGELEGMVATIVRMLHGKHIVAVTSLGCNATDIT